MVMMLPVITDASLGPGFQQRNSGSSTKLNEQNTQTKNTAAYQSQNFQEAGLASVVAETGLERADP